MRETDKEVLHRMFDKIKLSDMQKEDIMKKINEEETSAKKHRSFNVKRFATVMACALILVGATVGVAAKLNVVEKVSSVYTVWQEGDEQEVVLNEEEKQIVEDLSVDIGYEFEVDGGKVRIDGIMYDSRYIFLMYTAIADNGKLETASEFLKSNFEEESGLAFIIKGKEDVNFGWSSVSIDLDENAEGYQGCFIANVSPIQHIINYETGERTDYNNFSFSQGDEIVLTDRKYLKHMSVRSLDEVERIYGTLELTKPINDLVFNCENTDGMEVLETVTEIRLSPLSITIMGDEALRKTNGKGISYHYFESGDKKEYTLALYNTGCKGTAYYGIGKNLEHSPQPLTVRVGIFRTTVQEG